LPVRSDVELTIFNIVGQKVVTLPQGMQSAGEHTVVWDGNNESGNAVASGVYFYRLKAGDEVQSRKMLLLK
jgi:flagellar hook assembly protein FlgD